jgi:glycerophosphoryl diester phosphodiesterase
MRERGGKAAPSGGPQRAASTAFLDSPGPLAFAHRGGAAYQPENSWRAFEHAVGLGYRYLETDARATADGVLLAFHDETLDRLTGRKGRIAELPYRTVATALIDGREPIPKLEDLLGSWPDARFNIDIKHPAAIAPLAGVLRRTAAWDRVCVCSFSALRLRAARRALGRPVCTAASPAAIAAVAAGLGGGAARAVSQGAQCAQVPARMATPAFLRRAHALGWPVHAWTVNDPAQMARLLEAGVDGLITDDTVALRDVLSARGQWSA